MGNIFYIRVFTLFLSPIKIEGAQLAGWKHELHLLFKIVVSHEIEIGFSEFLRILDLGSTSPTTRDHVTHGIFSPTDLSSLSKELFKTFGICV